MIKSISIDREIELKDKQKQLFKANVKASKKKLQTFEMKLQMARGRGGAELDRILTESKPQGFPSLKQFENEYKRNNPRPIRLSTGEIVLTRAEMEQQEKDRKSRVVPLEALKKLEEVRKNKTFGVTSYFGGKVEGENLRTVKDYNGMNQYERDSRTLRRKGPWFPHYNTSCLPRWFAPGFYEYDDRVVKAKKPSVNIKQQSWRNPKTSEEFREERKKVAEQNMMHFNAVQERRGKKVKTPTFQRPITCERPHSMEEESIASITSPFSVLSAESTMDLKNPSSRARSPTNIHMLRRVSKDLQKVKVPLEGETDETLSRVDEVRHNNRYYFTPNAGVATAMNDEQFGRGPGVNVPKDYTMGALTLQRGLHEDDNDTVTTVLTRASSKSKTSKGRGAAQPHASPKADVDREMERDKIEGERKNPDSADGDWVVVTAEQNFTDKEDKMRADLAASIDLENLDGMESIGDYIKKWKKDVKIYSPLKPRLSQSFKRPPPHPADIAIAANARAREEAKAGGDDGDKLTEDEESFVSQQIEEEERFIRIKAKYPVKPHPSRTLPLYLLMTEKEAVVNDTVVGQADAYEPPETARTEPDPEIIRAKLEERQEAMETRQLEREWEDVLASEAAAMAFMKNINFG